MLVKPSEPYLEYRIVIYMILFSVFSRGFSKGYKDGELAGLLRSVDLHSLT